MTVQTRTLLSVLALVGCAPPVPPQPVTPKQAIAALSTVHGTFAEVGDGAYTLLPKSAGDGSVLRQISAFEGAVVPTLVDCLADTSTSQAEYEGTPASIGAVCLWALLQTRFVQELLREDVHKGLAPDGWVSYTAIEPQKQRHARAEWQAWLARHAQK